MKGLDSHYKKLFRKKSLGLIKFKMVAKTTWNMRVFNKIVLKSLFQLFSGIKKCSKELLSNEKHKYLATVFLEIKWHR